MSFDISYDSSVMTMINYTCEDPWLFTTNFDEDNQHNPASFVWSNPSNIEINGQILTLTFEIKEDAPVGNYEITLTKNGVVTNQDLDVIPCNIFSGNIIIVEQAVGDITNDGDIDACDAVLIAQYADRKFRKICRSKCACCSRI